MSSIAGTYLLNGGVMPDPRKSRIHQCGGSVPAVPLYFFRSNLTPAIALRIFIGLAVKNNCRPVRRCPHEKFDMKRLSTQLGGLWLAGLLSAASAMGGDWAAWRGPYQNGVSLETGLTSSTQGHSLANPPRRPLDAGNRQRPPVRHQPLRQRRHRTGADLRPRCRHRQGSLALQVQLLPHRRAQQPRRLGQPGRRSGDRAMSMPTACRASLLCLDRDGKLLWSKSSTELFGRVTRLRRADLYPAHRRRPRDRGLQ